jgi:1,4-dihydroxy-2-naphthoyl-CoA hydrolase
MFIRDLTPDKLNKLGEGSMSEHLGIEYLEVGASHLKARMPVDNRTKQPFGYLHGGASVVLAEEIGSMAANMTIDGTKFFAFGLEINANHIKSVKDGFITGIATPLHIGKSTHVWEIKIYNEGDELTCVSRLTMAVVPKN